MFLVNSAQTLVVLSAAAALFYAPLLITANATCEKAVSTERITEAITWINAGMTCGMALGPTVGGFFIDIWGGYSRVRCLRGNGNLRAPHRSGGTAIAKTARSLDVREQ